MSSKIPEDFAGGRPFLMGRNAKIKSTELTDSLGLGGLTGTIFGQTQPSSSGVTDVIGLKDQDYAINVFIDDLDESYWLAEDLVEVLEGGSKIEFKLL